MASGITINSNLAALSAQRRLGQSTQSVQQSFTRLSSGLRINKASDDAAGLAISESLNVDARVYTQGIRNLNDGISLTNIAEGAMQELTNITIRQRELATQSANGTLSLQQRQALNQEANALVDEFNRITSSTAFNGTKLIDKSLSGLNMQAGYGRDGSLSFTIGDELARAVGTGTFGARTSFTAGVNPKSIILGDVTGDGILDMVTADSYAGPGGNTTSVFIGNGDGSFKARATFASGSSPLSVQLGDLNGDGKTDLVTVDRYDAKASVFIGNGNGSFKARVSFAAEIELHAAALADFNGDGTLDLVGAARASDQVCVLLGNGNASFGASKNFAAGQQPISVATGDVNGDGVLDITAADYYYGGSGASVLLGNGDGSFRAKTSFATGPMTRDVTLGDINGDGRLDLVSADKASATFSVFIGNGDGSFKARTSILTEGSSFVSLRDLNGDGILDLAALEDGASTVSMRIGNGNGSFRTSSSYDVGFHAFSFGLGDLNQDGVLDVVTADTWANGASVLLANTVEVTTTARLNLCSRQGALDAMTTLDATLQRITSELGSLGSVQSRLGVAVNTLSVSRENYLSARSQITDADVAQESAQLLKNQILQQAGAAVLAQANQAPALALILLRSG
jgi:flagellin-like hook-associated protein FlgL